MFFTYVFFHQTISPGPNRHSEKWFQILLNIAEVFKFKSRKFNPPPCINETHIFLTFEIFLPNSTIHAWLIFLLSCLVKSLKAREVLQFLKNELPSCYTSDARL